MTTTGYRSQARQAVRAPLAAMAAIAGCLAFGQSPAAAQDAANPSFEASLKKYCPTKNLEFLKPDVLAKTADSFVADLPRDQAARVKELSKPGVDACAGSADDSCRTAAVLGSVRFAGLSEQLAQRFCQLPIACQDWFVCSDVAQAPAAAPVRQDERHDQTAAAAPPTQAPAPRPAPEAAPQVPPDEEMDEDVAAAPPPAPPPGPVARAPLPPAPEPAPPPVPRAPAAPTPERDPSAGPVARAPVPTLPPPPAVRPPPPLPPVEAPRSAQNAAPAGDGRAAVAGFYNALSRGDGIQAAQYLIPEKRGRGPFSAAAMQRFYGSLRQPLRLTDIEELGPTRLRARYSFVTQAGAVCAGNSVIAVRPTEEGALIESIRALSGC